MNTTVKQCACGCGHSTNGLFVHGHNMRSHGHASHYRKTGTYITWAGMMSRCLNEHHHKWPRYGGRGISVCQRWRIFENFLEDMGQRPDGMSIDRIDNDGNYEPSNCRWATRRQQQNNRNQVRILTFKGISQSIAEWARALNLKDQALRYRLHNGWSLEDALVSEHYQSHRKESGRRSR